MCCLLFESGLDFCVSRSLPTGASVGWSEDSWVPVESLFDVCRELLNHHLDLFF